MSCDEWSDLLVRFLAGRWRNSTVNRADNVKRNISVQCLMSMSMSVSMFKVQLYMYNF